MKKNYIALSAVNIAILKNLKYDIFHKNHQLFKEKESSEILKILVLIENI